MSDPYFWIMFITPLGFLVTGLGILYFTSHSR